MFIPIKVILFGSYSKGEDVEEISEVLMQTDEVRGALRPLVTMPEYEGTELEKKVPTSVYF